jgi:hypothetical protein
MALQSMFELTLKACQIGIIQTGAINQRKRYFPVHPMCFETFAVVIQSPFESTFTLIQHGQESEINGESEPAIKNR